MDGDEPLRANEAVALFRLTDRLYRARALPEVYEAALDAMVETLGCRRASILLFDSGGVMRFVAARGLSQEYRALLEGHSPWKAGVREAEPIFVRDIGETNEPDRVKDIIRKEGIRGLAFIPLMAWGEVVGKFMTYYEGPHEFSPQERDLAVTISRQVGFNLERSGAETARRIAEEELRKAEERFRMMSEDAPVMIWMSDPNGACLHLNRMLREFWGVDEAALATFDWQTSMHPDDAPEIGRRMMEAIARRAPVMVTGRYRRADGQMRVLETSARPRLSPEGEFLDMVGANVDITEREQSEQALRESEERFRLVIEAAPSGMLIADAGGRIVMVNAQSETLFGYSRDELIGRPVEMLVPARYRDGHPDFRATYQSRPSARPMGAGRELYALRKDGSEVPVEIGLSAMDTPDGPLAVAAIVDISARKKSEEQREILLAELNHRVKNTLAVVQGIAGQTFKGGAARPEARSAFEGRLLALARAHDLLTHSNWETAPLDEIVAFTLQSASVNDSRATASGPRVLLPPRQALALSMILHELYTNAVKYGAFSNDSGRIDVSWALTESGERELKLVWRESGGPPVTPPTHRGFGMVLLERTLAADVDGSVKTEFHPEGLICLISARMKDWRKPDRV